MSPTCELMIKMDHFLRFYLRTVVGLSRCTQALSSCSGWGVLCVVVWHCSDFSCCGAQTRALLQTDVV